MYLYPSIIPIYIALPWMEFENNPNVDVFHVVCHDEVPGSSSSSSSRTIKKYNKIIIINFLFFNNNLNNTSRYRYYTKCIIINIIFNYFIIIFCIIIIIIGMYEKEVKENFCAIYFFTKQHTIPNII